MCLGEGGERESSHHRGGLWGSIRERMWVWMCPFLAWCGVASSLALLIVFVIERGSKKEEINKKKKKKRKGKSGHKNAEEKRTIYCCVMVMWGCPGVGCVAKGGVQEVGW